MHPMKLYLLSFAAAWAPVGARLYHVPIGRRDAAAETNHRILDDVDQDNLYQARGVQYADLKVGCPEQPQSAIISTASDAIGFPCSGCTNDCGEGSHLNGLYHEKLSTCFSEVGCDDCRLHNHLTCSDEGKCPVHMSYAEGSSWTGVEVEDMVSVGGEDADEEAFPLRFGCQTDITGLFEGQIPDGIFGMNKHSGSAISQWSSLGYLDASAFSLCYNVREDVKKKSGVMVLGGTDTRLHDKPMVFAKDVGDVDYMVRVKDIHVKRGSALLSASDNGSNEPSVSLGLDGSDTATLDSGTTCTYLNSKWRASLTDAWDQMTDGKYNIFSSLSITADELDELPTLVFELEGTNENETIVVDYPPIRYMEKHSGGGYGFCMYGDGQGGPVTLGNTFMSGHDVLHDLDGKRIGFAESACEIHLVAEPEVPLPAELDNLGTPEVAQPVIKKPIVMQSHPEPIHIRVPLTRQQSPWTGVLYGVLASGLVALFYAVSFCCWGRDKSSFWKAPNTKHAYRLSWISLLVTFCAIVAGVTLYLMTGSSLFLVLCFENVVDFLSSAAVLWRFFAPSAVTKEVEVKLEAREQRASVAISMILVVLGVCIWATAIGDLFRGQENSEHQTAALAIALVSLFASGVLAIIKFRYSKALKSPSLYKDGICSTVGAVLSASLFVNTLIIIKKPGAWWIDPAVAIACGLASLVYGVWTLHAARRRDGLPIFSPRWWLLSHGTGQGVDSLEMTESESPAGELA